MSSVIEADNPIQLNSNFNNDSIATLTMRIVMKKVSVSPAEYESLQLSVSFQSVQPSRTTYEIITHNARLLTSIPVVIGGHIE